MGDTEIVPKGGNSLFFQFLDLFQAYISQVSALFYHEFIVS
jgi:hypothetical protein